MSLETSFSKEKSKENDEMEKGARIRKDFALNTSCHGLSEIYSSQNRGIKVIWIFLVLAVLGLLIWQVRHIFLI